MSSPSESPLHTKMLPSKRRRSASPENTQVIDLTQDESTPPKKRSILRKEEYTDEQPGPSNYKTEGDQNSENDGVVVVQRFSEADLDLEEFEKDDKTMDSLTQMFEDLEEALNQSIDSELMCPWKKDSFWNHKDVQTVPNIEGDDPQRPRFRYRLFFHVFYKCYCTVLRKENDTEHNQNPTYVWWKSRYSARFLKNVLVPLVRDLRTIQPGTLLGENPYLEKDYETFYNHPSTLIFTENQIYVRPYSVSTQNYTIRIKMFQKFPTPVQLDKEGKVFWWRGYSCSFSISEFINNLLTIRDMGRLYYSKIEDLRKASTEGGSNPKRARG